MSGNLTKYEQLQHRHLSLLRALQEASVGVKCDANGDWTVQPYAGMIDTLGHPVGGIERRGLTKEEIYDLFDVPHWVAGLNDAALTARRKFSVGELDKVFTGKDWRVDVRKLYGNLAPPIPGDNELYSEYCVLREAHQSGKDFIMASSIPTILMYTSNPLKFAAGLPPEPMPGVEGWGMALKIVGNTVHGSICGEPFSVEYSDKLADLIRCSYGVIVRAPAKA